ncbi:homoserine O-acetyltransferase [Aphanomyces invadans]|uniref:Homoserine O-acetyltransferase n=1 Tax=Aphanomyces invadans TaxID=157072 RepID=A0A024ULA1_9STRA|nr:homoserine O-acetyltransferase [Aphanomyces invadans]ETW06930.1 homoserine O-acetyltransferase [Aphanomyces invadans]|eukprot:XP_008865005.1 homoserine O-acetyltransferase [Aphanomyces invadans]
MPPVDTPAKPAIEDDYGVMEACKQVFHVPSFELESGVSLEAVDVNYKTFGTLNDAKDNVLFVCHALTGNAALDSWWGGLLGDGKPFDTSKYLVVCANVLGSCYGTTGPTSINPRTGKQYGQSFPAVTIRDTVRLHIRLVVEEIGASQVACVVGGSLGGMQTLEWGFLGQALVQKIAVIACGAQHSGWQIAISEVQRQAIYRDPNYNNGDYDSASPPHSGLALARQIAMITYRTHGVYNDKFGRNALDDDPSTFTVQSYLDYQGRKFLSRFDANAYIAIMNMMDTHDIGRGRGGVEAACQLLHALPVLIVGIDSDVIYPITEQAQLHAYLPHSTFRVIQSPHGHDGFLLEQDAVGQAVRSFLG